MTTKKKKSAKQKRILVIALVVAVAIVAGSTFAWFSSKDEVTNRLSASGDYNVAIAEDFQAPADWIPGQTINKDVSAVNTGSVDAFVRMWFGGQMRLLSETSKTDKVDATTAGSLTTALTSVDDEDKTKLGLNYYDANNKIYYKTLSDVKIDNPSDYANSDPESDDPTTNDNEPAGFSEVQSAQAAGVLVYAPANSKYSWALEQATTLNVVDGTGTREKNLPKGTVVGTSGTDDIDETLVGYSASDSNYYGSIDASTFKPQTSGLYLFRRTVYETEDGTANEYEYSGYYYENGVYFALHTETADIGNSEYVIPANAVDDNSDSIPSKDQVLPVTPNSSSIFLFTAKETLLDNSNNKLSWNYNAPSGTTPASFDVSYTAVTDKPIEINIQLANVGAGSEQWTAITDSNSSNNTTFYYNNDVEAADTTTKLVDSVTLSDDTVTGAYLAFDFDLDVFMDSVQVTRDEAGNEGYDSVKPWSSSESQDPTVTNIAATGADNGTRTTASEISLIKWSKS